MEYICQWSKFHLVITYFNKQGEFTKYHCTGCLWSRWNLLCCVLAPQESHFFWSVWFAAPRLLLCCPQLVQVKPYPKCPCTPSESNLGFTAAILFLCVIWGLDRKTRNCPSPAAVPKCTSQPGMRGTSCKAVTFHPWGEMQLGAKDGVLGSTHQYWPCCSKKLCPVTEILIPG